MTRRRVVASWALTGLLLMAVLPACGDDEDSSDGTSSTTSTTTAGSSSTTTAVPSPEGSVVVYFLRDERVGAARRPGPSDDGVARAAMTELLAGPTDADAEAGLATAVPAGTRLLGVSIAEGTATVDLSAEFGSGGGSSSMQGRVAQVVYTLTQFPTVQRVAFRIDGEPVTAVGGEGVMVDPPQTRADWEALTPAILVESPLPGDRVTSPVDVSGTANTFEATVLVRLTDSAGTQLVLDFTTATSGSGTRGTFAHPLAFSGAAAGPAELEVFEESAKDGSPINVVRIPVII